MRYLALAVDFDGVVASQGRPSRAAISAIQRLKSSGRRVVLITGRRIAQLLEDCPDLSPFDLIVAENGAVLYEPRTREETLLAPSLPPEFAERLIEAGVEPVEIGRVIVSTWVPHHVAVLDVIRKMGLELHIVFNRTAVMVVPAGVSKASGMEFALRKLGLSRHEAVGVGDSENDHSFLQRCECALTVSNAVPAIRSIAARVATRANGEGLAELIDELIASDLSDLQGRLGKNLVALGQREDGTRLTIPPYGHNILIAGPSGSGKSTVTAGIVERLMQMAYQVCVVDPEGDYGTLEDMLTLGNQQHAVTVNEVLSILENPRIALNVNLLGIPLADRPQFFGQLFPSLQAMRTRTGRPHWIILDEAHHMLPCDWAPLGKALPQSVGETVLVTVHPDHVAAAALALVDTIIAVGPAPEVTIAKFARVTCQPLDWPSGLTHRPGRVVSWSPRTGAAPFSMQVIPGRAERIRHHRKYAEGNMHYRSFFFRGPGNRQNLKAQNLTVFCQIADGIDEDTWLFHLRRGDFSRWFRGAVKDRYLAEQAERIEQRQDLSPPETRHLIRSLIESRYTLPE